MKKVYFLLFFFCLSCFIAYAEVSERDMLSKLDNSLKNREKFEKLKQEEIRKLHIEASKAANMRSLYQADINLYDAYRSYKYDLASVYAKKLEQLALKLHDPGCVVESRCAKTFCLLSAGLYKEAFDEFHSIDIARVSNRYHICYYQLASRLFYDIADYNHAPAYQENYVRQGGIYIDSLLELLPEKSTAWWYAKGMKQMKKRQYDASTYSFKMLLRKPNLDTHLKAIINSCLGWVAYLQKDESSSMKYLIQAAIFDNESATKETTALREVGALLYKQGDIWHATHYVQMALNDANFYGARQRKIEIGNILPIIQQDRFNMVEKQRNIILIATLIAVALLVVLFSSFILIRRQMKKLQEARHIIEERNHSLQQTNDQLQEANKIKNEYIGKSFYVNSEYIEKVEKLYKTVDRKIATRQFEDLRSLLKESTFIAERKNMYAGFDETFLSLFPDFVEKFNMLFKPVDRKTPQRAHSLTTEMRIFALIRLGITDSERIAKFLDYSVHTINTYKTRIKNKSIVENEDFETEIMKM